jgi:ABC-type oligopeptide transport system ATPase subunit
MMNRGRIEEAGVARTVLEHPRSDYTRTLLAAVPRIAPTAVS